MLSPPEILHYNFYMYFLFFITPVTHPNLNITIVRIVGENSQSEPCLLPVLYKNHIFELLLKLSSFICLCVFCLPAAVKQSLYIYGPVGENCFCISCEISHGTASNLCFPIYGWLLNHGKLKCASCLCLFTESQIKLQEVIVCGCPLHRCHSWVGLWRAPRGS